MTHSHLSPARFGKNFHYLLKARLENHLPEETTYEQRHFFVGPKVLLISNPSLNLGGQEQKVTLHEEKDFRVPGGGAEGLGKQGAPWMFEKLSHLTDY